MKRKASKAKQEDATESPPARTRSTRHTRGTASQVDEQPSEPVKPRTQRGKQARTARGKAAPEGDDNDALPLQQLAASQHTSPHGDGDAAPTSPPPATGDGGGRAAEGDDGWEPDRNSPPRQQKIPIANGGVDGEADVHHGDGDGDPEEDVDVAVKTQADDTQQALDAPEPVQMDDTKETIKHDTNDTRSPPASTHACDTHPPSSATQPQEKDATTDAATPAAAGATPQKITPQKNVKWGKRARDAPSTRTHEVSDMPPPPPTQEDTSPAAKTAKTTSTATAGAAAAAVSKGGEGTGGHVVQKPAAAAHAGTEVGGSQAAGAAQAGAGGKTSTGGETGTPSATAEGKAGGKAGGKESGKAGEKGAGGPPSSQGGGGAGGGGLMEQCVQAVSDMEHVMGLARQLVDAMQQTGHLLSSLAKAAPSHSVSDLSAALQGTGLGKVLKRYCKDLQQGGGVMGEHTRIARTSLDSIKKRFEQRAGSVENGQAQPSALGRQPSTTSQPPQATAGGAGNVMSRKPSGGVGRTAAGAGGAGIGGAGAAGTGAAGTAGGAVSPLSKRAAGDTAQVASATVLPLKTATTPFKSTGDPLRDKAIYALQSAMQAPLQVNVAPMARRLEELIFTVKPAVEGQVDASYKEAIMRLRALLAHDSREHVPGLALALADGGVAAEAVVSCLADREAVVGHLFAPVGGPQLQAPPSPRGGGAVWKAENPP